MVKPKVRLEDVARIAGVSITTVSRALNDSHVVNRITKRRVWNVAVDSHYIDRRHLPDTGAASDCTLGLFISSSLAQESLLFNPFYQEMISSIGQAARNQGCSLLLSKLCPRAENDLTVLWEKAQVDGGIFIGQSNLHDHFNDLTRITENFIVWGQSIPGQKYRTVGSDNLAGGMSATNHLIAQARKKIVYLGETEGAEMRYRFQGYLNALAGARIAYNPQLAISTASDATAAEVAVKSLIKAGIQFDGIFAASDAIAFGALAALEQAGIAVPDTVAIVGYDNTRMADYSRPRLSTISQDLMTAGSLMVSKLVGSAANDGAVTDFLPTTLIVRDSCGAQARVRAAG